VATGQSVPPALAPSLGDVELIRVRSTGGAAQVQTVVGSPPFEAGVLGVALSPKVVDGSERTVVQLMLDDDRGGFDRSLLDCPLVAEVRTPAGDLVTRDLFDHDGFRRRLSDERSQGGDELRGVLVITAGELPPAYLRLAFLDLPVAHTAGCDVVVTRHQRDRLLDVVDRAFADGSVDEREHHGLRTTIEQRHPA
jgi:hypothetical protein